MELKKKYEDELDKANKALEAGKDGSCIAHFYAASLLAKIIVEGMNDSPTVASAPESESQKQEEIAVEPQDESLFLKTEKAYVKVNVRKIKATLVFQPVRGDDRYLFRRGNGAHYVLIKDTKMMGVVGHNYACTLKRNSYYFRSLQIPLFLHHVFGVEKNDPDYKHWVRIMAIAMKRAETAFIKSHPSDDAKK